MQNYAKDAVKQLGVSAYVGGVLAVDADVYPAVSNYMAKVFGIFSEKPRIGCSWIDSAGRVTDFQVQYAAVPSFGDFTTTAFFALPVADLQKRGGQVVVKLWNADPSPQAIVLAEEYYTAENLLAVAQSVPLQNIGNAVVNTVENVANTAQLASSALPLALLIGAAIIFSNMRK